MIEIYHRVTPPCPYCIKAKKLVVDRGVEHTLYEIGKDISRDEVLAKFPLAKTVPIVVVDGKWIGGYTDLFTHLTK